MKNNDYYILFAADGTYSIVEQCSKTGGLVIIKDSLDYERTTEYINYLRDGNEQTEATFKG